MEHSYYQERISAYFDGELSEEERRMVREHLQECPQCRALLDELGRLEGLAERHVDIPDGDYWEQSARRIEERLGPEEEGKVVDVAGGWRGLGWKLAGVAAALVVLTFVGVHRDDIFQMDKSDRAPSVVKSPAVASPADTTVVRRTVREESQTKEAPEERGRGERAEGRDLTSPSPPDIGTSSDLERGDDQGQPRDLDVSELTAEVEPQPGRPEENVTTGAAVSPAVETSKRGSEVPEAVGAGREKVVGRDMAADEGPSAEAASEVSVHAEPQYAAGTVSSAHQDRPGLMPAKGTDQGEVFEELAFISDDAAKRVYPMAANELLVTGSLLDSVAISSVSDTSDPAAWRYLRDSLQTLYADSWSELSERESRLGKGQAASKAAAASSEFERVEAERCLVEAHYRVGLLTSDTAEMKASEAFLGEYVTKAESIFKEKAGAYAAELKSRRE